MEKIKKCPKCNSEMQAGYKLYPNHGDIYLTAKWVSELKEIRTLGAFLGYDAINGVDIKCYKCNSCGYLENYVE